MPETLSACRATRAGGDSPETGSSRSAFFERVFDVVAHIPRGRVTTYGAIARALGAPRAARSVGWALSVAPAEAGLPCHRVVDRNGNLSGGWHWGHPDVMAALLSDENVPFLEPYRVDLTRCLWVPDPTPDSSPTARSWPD
jgi:methylated-DNA-protein-cysteine methyltransferase related protein